MERTLCATKFKLNRGSRDILLDGIYYLKFLQGKADFENIPQTVETDTASTRQSITDNLDSFVQTIDDGLKEITKLSDDVSARTHQHTHAYKDEKML